MLIKILTLPYCIEKQVMEKVNFKQNFYGRDSEEPALLFYFGAGSRKEKRNKKKVKGKRIEKITQSYFNRYFEALFKLQLCLFWLFWSFWLLRCGFIQTSFTKPLSQDPATHFLNSFMTEVPIV